MTTAVDPVRRLALAAVLILLAGAAALALAERSVAAYGDGYDVMPINSGPGTLAVPAVPDSTRYFWAGTCDRAGAPPPGADLAPLGGIGTVPSTTEAPSSPGGDAAILDVPLLDGVRDCIDWRLGINSSGDSGTGPTDIWDTPPSWRLPPVSQAGARPDGTTTFAVKREGDTDNFYVDLPAGFVGDPGGVPKCTAEQFAVKPQQCHPSTQVGVLTLRHLSGNGGSFGSFNANVDTVPVYNLEPRKGNAAELGLVQISGEGRVTSRIVAKARTSGDFGVTGFVGQIPGSALPLSAQSITFWGVPWDSAHDVWRAPQGLASGSTGCHELPGTVGDKVIPSGGLSPGCRQSYDPSWGPLRPFLSNPTECSGQQLTTGLATDAYQRPGAFTADGDPDLSDSDWKTAQSPAPPVTGCDKPPFEPGATFAPTSTAADSPSGLSVDVTVPQNRDLPFGPPAPGADQGEIDAYVDAALAHWKSDAGLATAQLDKTVVTLPEGVSVNPAAASGLLACPDSVLGLRQLGNPPLFNNVDPFDGRGVECPGSSKIGTVEVETPLLEEPLTGEVVLGEPRSKNPLSGQMLRLFLIVRNQDRGIVAKIHGSTVADPVTGRLTTTFDNNPRIPFEKLHLEIEGGSRGVLAMPQACGAKSTQSVFSPWTAAHGEQPPNAVSRTIADGFTVGGDCSRPFAPPLTAGMDNRQGGAGGTFSFQFSRRDGERWLRGLTAKLPTGLLASVRDVPLCSSAQAAAAACPAASRIGTVDAGAGSGTPFFLERKGELFLTEGYRGCAYGLAVKVRAIAGPFRGPWELSPIVVRQAVCVDRTTAQVTAISDPFPTIHHGIPLRVRQVTVKVDRAGFMRNPSDCSAKRIEAKLTSSDGLAVDRSVPFQAIGCAALAFKPKLKMSLIGKKQTKTGKHPGVRAVVTQKRGEAGIAKAVVRLPLSLALDPDNAQALCEYEDGTKPDIERHCPKGSIVGSARAVSPLLKKPLTGRVYFVKNVRISSTGNRIATLPMIVVALRGEIAVNLRGVSRTTKAGKLVNTFAKVPDAPVSRFSLSIAGGRNGILAVTRTRRAKIDVCRRRNVVEADMNGQNGRRRDSSVLLETPCPKAKSRRR
jgi:hypothetical protein